METWTTRNIPPQQDRRAVITGATGGLGYETALALAGAGAEVVLTGRNAAKGAAALAKIRAAYPQSIIRYADLDLADLASVKAFADRFADEHDMLDLLVNNAGVLSVCPVAEMALAEWRRVMEVNATGTFLVSRAVVRRMIAAERGGSLVSIASIAGKRGNPKLAHYSASKFAVVGFTQALAQEVAAHGIRVNAVCPGLVETAMIDDLNAALGASVPEWLRHQAIRRSQTPADIAWAVACLHGAQSVTGQSVNVDGGTLFD